MKSALSLLIAVSFAGVALLGFAMVNHSASHANPDCFVATFANSATCPDTLINFVNYHASALQSLSQALLAVGLLIAGIILLPAFFKLIAANFLIPLERRRELSFATAISGRKITRWLALFENSPSF
ncbi:MAG: hypothetical protein A3J09_01075 [Candidatus Zambryskibacteria bacterium RIFCSPLOWO2_02_FULL_51_21]|uniref:Uncharacterized protein n=1 Tax=Candidatus Zambryskibacteria bacterium RIFCSPHIGHO2_02_FULL_43_37 TaxID=1802749 RepID=A0A1G2THB5_9BACT|nr:MAG: hypothetical protein A2723_01075 [Candidatus Zambryskibacteria bacterium RIFCSPHIGHO2_01_FULL_52_18]OHA96592.1 MAG: hypothetical protein A3D49_01825 [Candidatus Zambryskibacteria bacterium RIFCSPHIGHO2_02_FULL_43_37]OHB07641.1 MAG: hypothetical protein A2944_00845 [Candidatus Zambryskibacteria bacterium RIFCSPLOWO2_01_FULL_52_12]OHB11144.1 MAG: hypothetical protein A3J09_01075 [Candidatus Zambryskibacteria bacterium RIFCSPLOWO2_02_FULL_51_21]